MLKGQGPHDGTAQRRGVSPRYLFGVWSRNVLRSVKMTSHIEITRSTEVCKEKMRSGGEDKMFQERGAGWTQLRRQEQNCSWRSIRASGL